jgi:CRP/FNR family transcriptional regulator
MTAVSPLALRRCSWFSSLAREPLTRLAVSATFGISDREQWLYEEGSPADAVYLITRGAARWIRGDGFGRAFVLEVLTFDWTLHAAGSVVRGGAHKLGLQTLHRLHYIRIPSEVFLWVLEASLELTKRAAASLAGDVHSLADTAGNLGLLDIRGRVAKALLDSADQAGHARFLVTQADIAGQLGMSRQSFNEILSELRTRGLIRGTGRGTLVVRDREGLRRLLRSGS